MAKQHPLSAYLPAGDVEHRALRRLAASIEASNRLSPDRWGVTKLDKFLRLNLGKIEVATLSPRSIRLFVAFEGLPAKLPNHSSLVLAVRGLDDPSAGYYKSVPGSVLCQIKNLDAPDLDALLATMEQSHLQLLRKAALTGRNPMTVKGHSVELIQEIEQLLGVSLPQPAYATRDTGASRS